MSTRINLFFKAFENPNLVEKGKEAFLEIGE